MSTDLVPVNAGPRLLHYSQRRMLKRPLATCVQAHPYGDMTSFKPFGLWISVEGAYDWKWWCNAEGFRLEDLRHAHQVILRPGAKIMRISTLEELDDFNAEYRPQMTIQAMSEASVAPDRAMALRSLHGRFGSRSIGIDWRRVAEKHDGIIIAPYQWERRLGDMLWYYTWDCASGCVWNAKAIAEIRLLDEKVIDERAVRRSIHERMRFSPRKSKKVLRRLTEIRFELDPQ